MASWPYSFELCLELRFAFPICFAPQLPAVASRSLGPSFPRRPLFPLFKTFWSGFLGLGSGGV